jgi:hypothetical protein
VLTAHNGGPLELSGTPLENDPSVTFTLDDRLRLRSCNLAWDRFAAENGGGRLMRPAVMGRSILEFISGPLADYYREAYSRMIGRDVAWRHEYECSSEGAFRLFAMEVYPLPGRSGLLVVNCRRVQEPHTREAMAAAESVYGTPDGLFVMCSNCRRTRRNGVEEIWDWAPGFLSVPGRRVSHGLCPPCGEHYMRMVETIG